ncbi:23S rRNA (adenine(1618)-N(6))-methyltransferase RlmF [Marinomonas sp. THO17]|uniref:23S rRNA (adenine(1618)-N(6))-methyltransferase RlmF n=1 Tax=Marinomonas sp. THO17 TaxID=3149048 RepID=UPI00336C22C8
MTHKAHSSKGKGNKKLELHPRNPHRARYDFALLADSCPELSHYIRLNKYGNESLDFADPLAVKTLNRALLNHFYGVAFWDIPEGFLCPPIPGRADYIHYLADLLADSNNGVIPRGKEIKVLDVGVGANCVYPIVGHQEYGWQFVGSDVNSIAVATASTIVKSNSCLKEAISIRQQANQEHIFDGVWQADERFDLTMCNPPFHTSESAMQQESQRKWRGLKGGKPAGSMANNKRLNFGGTAAELWCEGGEVGFISRMIRESQAVADQCFWFTSLVARHSNLERLKRELQKVGAKQVKVIEMAQGQKISRFIAWSFLGDDQIDYWRDFYWQH